MKNVTWIIAVCLSITACAVDDEIVDDADPNGGADTVPAEVTETMPTEESMTLPSFFDSNSAGLTANQETQAALGLARLSIAGVTVALQLALLVPRATFASTLARTPVKEDDGWHWTRNYPLMGWQTDLYGDLADQQLSISMRMTGLNNNNSDVQDFEWFTGAHRRGEGNWTFYDPNREGAVLTIDWQVAGATDKTLVFTNVSDNAERTGDTVTYRLDGAAASMTIIDMQNADGERVDFAVTWNTEDGSGNLMRNDEMHCWDTLANGQSDIDCPM